MLTFSSGARNRLSQAVRDSLRAFATAERRPTQRRKVLLEAMEPRLLLSADPAFSADAGALTAQFTGANDLIGIEMMSSEASANGGVILKFTYDDAGVTKSITKGDATDGITALTIKGGAGDDRITLVNDLVIPLTVDGEAGNDTLVGQPLGTEWTIEGADSGSATGIVNFSGIENLVGGSDPTPGRGVDIFEFEAAGSISGLIDGGAGDDVIIGPDLVNSWTLDGADAGTLNGATATFVGIENLSGGELADTFTVQAAGSLSGILYGGVNTSDEPVDTLDFSLLGTAVTVDLWAATASAGAATVVGEIAGIDDLIGTGSADDLLKGTGEAGDVIVWTIDGPDAGEVQGIRFSAFENLTGRDVASDSFYFARSSAAVFGSLSGTIDGGTGAGALDGFAVEKSVDSDAEPSNLSIIVASDAAGTVTLDGRTVNYVRMDPFAPVDDDDLSHVVIRGSVIADDIVVEDADPSSGVDGMLRVTFNDLSFWDGSGFLNSFLVANPIASVDPDAAPPSLTIITGSGGDTITIKSLDAKFAAGLRIYGNASGVALPESDAAQDVIRLEGDIYTRGGLLEVFGDDIIVSDGVVLSTLVNTALIDGDPDYSGGSNDIVFRARRVGTPEIENLTPVGYIPKSVSIDIGDGAKLLAANIYLVSQAEDRKISTQLGLTTLESTFSFDVGVAFLTDLLTIPLKVLVKDATSTVTIGAGAQIRAENVIGIYSNAATDAMMKLCADPETMPGPDGIVKAIKPELNKIFKPAFLGRLVIIPYYPIRDEALRKIILLKLGKIQKRIRENHKIDLLCSDALIEEIGRRCTEVESGARNVDNILTNTLLPEISRQLLTRIAEGQKLESIQVTVGQDGNFMYS